MRYKSLANHGWTTGCKTTVHFSAQVELFSFTVKFRTTQPVSNTIYTEAYLSAHKSGL